MSGPLFFDRVQETSSTTGTGTYTLLGAILGFQSFAAVGDANTCYYAAEAVDSDGVPTGDWEVGLGTYASAGATLARTSVLASSNGGAAVNWAAGIKRVFLVDPATYLASLIVSGGPLGTPSSGVLTNVTGLTTTGMVDNAVTNAKLADMNALTTKVRAANSSGDPSDLAISDGETAKRVGTSMVSGRFGPASMTVLTSGTSATYTVPAGIYRLKVRMVGGGGGGGGTDSAVGQAGCSQGGASGAYAEKLYSTTPGTNFTYSVGALGAGGAAGNNSGSAGGDTKFDEAGSVVTAGGGSGGGSLATGTSVTLSGSGAVPTASGGDVNIPGELALRGIRLSGTQAFGTSGANGPFGSGGIAGNAAAAANASGFGAGGGGSWHQGGTDLAGGNGVAGLIIVEEYN